MAKIWLFIKSKRKIYYLNITESIKKNFTYHFIANNDETTVRLAEHGVYIVISDNRIIKVIF